MPRPRKIRWVGNQPEVSLFKPAGIPSLELAWIKMTLDEFEAITLIDGDGLGQEEVAGMMGVSRPTVTRILGRARKKLAQMLTTPGALAIEGGPVSIRQSCGCKERARCHRYDCRICQGRAIIIEKEEENARK